MEKIQLLHTCPLTPKQQGLPLHTNAHMKRLTLVLFLKSLNRRISTCLAAKTASSTIQEIFKVSASLEEWQTLAVGKVGALVLGGVLRGEPPDLVRAREWLATGWVTEVQRENVWHDCSLRFYSVLTEMMKTQLATIWPNTSLIMHTWEVCRAF